jgi:hypothetical protein
MAFLGWRWLNDSAVELNFQSRWLSIRKTIKVEDNSVVISYTFSALEGAKVVRAEISVFADWPYTIDSYKGSGSLFFLTIWRKSFAFTATEGSTSKYLKEDQPRVVVTKNFGSERGILTLKVDCLDARPSGLPAYRASIFDYLSSQSGKKYVVSLKANPDRFGNVTSSFLPSLYLVDSYQSVRIAVKEPVSFVLADSYVRFSFYTYTNETTPLLYVIDSYIRANFSTYGAFYTEAPSGGRVLNESLLQGGGRVVSYETAGLLIDKVVTTLGSTVSFYYKFKAKDGGKVTAVEGVIWLPWGMNYTYSIGKGYIVLNTPMGPFNISYGELNASIGPHTEGGQPAIRLYGSGDVLSFSIKAIQPIYLDYFATSRPVMDGSDIARLSTPYLMGPWVESPAGAVIVSMAPNRWIAKTKALTFEKRLNVSEGKVDVLYTARPNNGSNAVILGGWGLVWMNLDISKVEHKAIHNGLEVGGFNIVGGPSTVTALLGISEYWTPILNITFTGNELAVSLRGELKHNYQTSNMGRLDDKVVLEGFIQRFYEESPSNAQVLKDFNEPDSGLRIIEYKTAGLFFVKTVKALDSKSVTVTYQVIASLGAVERLEAIYNLKARIWIPWDRLLLNYSIQNSYINLTLDVGRFLIFISPTPHNVSLVGDPQPSFLITYEVKPSEVFSYSITVSSPRPLTITYQEGGRPLQTSSDVLTVNAMHGYLRLEYDIGDLKIFRVVEQD